MPVGYQVLYRIGCTPWDVDALTAPDPLREIAEATAPAPRRALDLGCGTGRQAVYLAEHGWTVTGVDAVAAALDKARTRSAAGGVSVDWVEGDVARLQELVGGERAYDLILDMGCFHGLSERQRQLCAAGIDAVSAPEATLLLMAFKPGRRGPAPRGLDRDELLRLFRGWVLKSELPATELTLPGPLRGAGPTWYRLRRTARRN